MLILDRLVSAAISDASANEVTAPFTGNEWSYARIIWLMGFHRTRRYGRNGPASEITWAILLGDQVVGSVRLTSASRRKRRRVRAVSAGLKTCRKPSPEQISCGATEPLTLATRHMTH